MKFINSSSDSSHDHELKSQSIIKEVEVTRDIYILGTRRLKLSSSILHCIAALNLWTELQGSPGVGRL